MPTRITEPATDDDPSRRSFEIHTQGDSVFLTRMDKGHQECFVFDRTEFLDAISHEFAQGPMEDILAL